jgi:hypothetical protein
VLLDGCPEREAEERREEGRGREDDKKSFVHIA